MKNYERVFILFCCLVHVVDHCGQVWSNKCYVKQQSIGCDELDQKGGVVDGRTTCKHRIRNHTQHIMILVIPG